MSTLTIILLICLFTFLINIPFGYFRGKSRKFSVQWFLYVHLPVPLVILVRIFTHTDYKYIPLFIFIAIAGQFFGGKLVAD
ncbi:MAG: hypothetical protein WC291_00275 [Thermodesulfovibrionales bacterium]|jgi:hypothetical protein